MKIKFIIDFIGSIALLISLLFLGIEINQSNAIAKATVRQTINDNDVEYLETFLDQKVVPKANHKLNLGEELSPYEAQQLIWQQHINFRVFDNGYYQFLNGLLDESEWLKYHSIIVTLFQTNPYVAEMWSIYGKNFSPPFQKQIEQIQSQLKNQK